MNLAYFLLFAVSVALFLAGLPLLTTCLQNLAGSQLDRFPSQTIGTAPRAFSPVYWSPPRFTAPPPSPFLHWPGGQRHLRPHPAGRHYHGLQHRHHLHRPSVLAHRPGRRQLRPGLAGPQPPGASADGLWPFAYAACTAEAHQFTGGMLLGLGMILSGLAGMESALAPWAPIPPWGCSLSSSPTSGRSP